MGAFSPIHWLIVLAFLAGVFPAARILQRTGHSPWWAILYFVPLIGWLGMWALAFARWPAVDSTDRPSTLV